MATAADAGVVAVGFVAVVGAWYLIRARPVSIWAATGLTFAALGLLSFIGDRVRWAEEVEVFAAIVVGLGSGIALYALTVAFFRVARRWEALRRQTDELYRRREGASPLITVGVGAVVASSGEELFWRGLVQGLAVAVFGSLQGAALAWTMYVGANLASGSLPIVIGAVVGGGVWGALAWWSGGVAASFASHVAWTALMIARPPHE
jgi:membrane protease YdiL (CAAX protease family)